MMYWIFQGWEEEDGSLQLDLSIFNLHSVFKEVLNLVRPIASVKKLAINLSLASDVPEYGFGDKKRLTQIILNMVMLSNSPRRETSQSQLLSQNQTS
ncbi:unnamed protein product [Rhodiola kirilowii]